MIRILALGLLFALSGCAGRTDDNGCPAWFVFYGCGT